MYIQFSRLGCQSKIYRRSCIKIFVCCYNFEFKLNISSQNKKIKKYQNDFLINFNINKHLLVLVNCIQSLSEANEKGIKNPFIPFLNSKLVFLRILFEKLPNMIPNVPAASCFEATYNTLVYANRAKNIKTVATQNLLMAQNHISNYAQLISNQRQENEELKLLIQQQQSHLQNPQLKLSQIKQIILKVLNKVKIIGFLIGIPQLIKC